MPNGHNEATRLLGVIDRMVEQRTKSGANIEVTYGQVFGVQGTVASVYLAGSRELAESDGGIPEPSDGFRIPGYLRIVPGDYVRVSMDVRGHRWIDEYLLPLSKSVDPPYSAILGSRQAILGEIILGGGPPTITSIAYPKIALDLANGVILFGDGTVPPNVPFGINNIHTHP